MQKLQSNSSRAGDLFGIAADIDGDRILIGARGRRISNQSTAGAAFIFERQLDNSWIQTAQLISDKPNPDSEMGNKVALDGDRAVVGAWLTYTRANRAGAIFVFDLENGAWKRNFKLYSLDAVAGDILGHDVSVSGEIVVGGAFNEDNVQGVNAGGAYIYDLGRVSPASAVFRNAGSKPPSLLISGAIGGRPVLGDSLILDLDVLSSGHGMGLVLGYAGSADVRLARAKPSCWIPCSPLENCSACRFKRLRFPMR
jgi:hypothetical protein